LPGRALPGRAHSGSSVRGVGSTRGRALGATVGETFRVTNSSEPRHGSYADGAAVESASRR
jgi:hypothetical protein